MPSSILNSDDGVISGTSGLKSSGGDDGVLVFQSKGTETARINTDKQIVAAAGTASLPALTTTGDVNTGIFFPAADTIAFAEGGAEAMRITSDGKVLVNATADNNKWDNTTIGGNLFQVERSVSSGDSAISIANNPGTAANSFSALYLGRSRGTSNNSYTVVAADDGLGKLSFQGADGSEFVEAASVRGYVDGTPGANDMPGRLSFWTTADGSATPTERARITSAGKLVMASTADGLPGFIQAGITNNTGSLNGVIAVAANSNGGYPIACRAEDTSQGLLGFFNQSNSLIGSITRSGSNVVYNTSSDYRLKENIAPMTGALATVAQLNPVTYTWIADGSAGQGFIAHELQEVAPYAVSGEKDGEEMQGVDYGKITPLLTAALQEAIAEIQSLKARVAELEAK